MPATPTPTSATNAARSRRRHPAERPRRRSTLVLLSVVLAMLAGLFPLAGARADGLACTITWDGQAGTHDWHHAANWRRSKA